MADGITRRHLVVGTGGMVAAGSIGVGVRAAALPQDDAMLELSAVDAVGAMRRGEIRAEAYAQALLARAKQCAALNAFISFDADQVLAAARAADLKRASGAALGALHGLPIPIKDSVNTKDYPTTGGTPALRYFRPESDAPLVHTLRMAGAIAMGKTNLHELSFGWTSNNLAYGAVHNPYDATRVPGGSTGGTAAAIAARIAPLGVAEDTEGSIRVPAALCGIVGFRPTTGRYPTTAVVPITPLFDQIGPHARSVADAALFDAVVTGDAKPIVPVALAGLRLGVDRGFFEGLDGEVERVTNEALKRLRAAGVVIVEAPVAQLRDLIAKTTGPIQLHDVVPSLVHYLFEYDTGIHYEELIAQASDDIKAIFASFVLPGSPYHVSEEAYAAARDVHLPALRDAFKRWFADNRVAAMVFPTTRIPAARIGQQQVEIGGAQVPYNDAISRNIASGSTAGLPCLVLPAGMTKDGLPVSLELDGPSGHDREMLALGLAVERLLDRLPPPRFGA